MKIEMEVQEFIKQSWIAEDYEATNVEYIREELNQMIRNKSQSAAFIAALATAVGEMTIVLKTKQGLI